MKKTAMAPRPPKKDPKKDDKKTAKMGGKKTRC